MITIQAIKPSDWSEAWAIMQPVFAAGETFAFAPDTTEAEAFAAFVTAPCATFVAIDEQARLVGIYYLRANQPGLGSHVANAGYIVSEAARGRGVASLMCEHSQAEARRRGFLALQFNTVVSTNEPALRLWTKHGFKVVGRVPKAFRHARHGLVDVIIMHKALDA